MPYFEHKDLHDSKIRKIISEYKCLYLLKCHSKIHLSLSRSNPVNPERRIQFLQEKNSKEFQRSGFESQVMKKQTSFLSDTDCQTRWKSQRNPKQNDKQFLQRTKSTSQKSSTFIFYFRNNSCCLQRFISGIIVNFILIRVIIVI